ncbi:conserved hypothetical protein [Frankia canadensis]|uniref:Uncharacterized protein n=1 Tax=Frankia canadensis TaxID=1836972 RepID=A0A2I2L102_9ACTN|nr:GTP-binding protein [Frankia canadensis]SNQ51601.1 conserved hypothetical protein [Frankia canadensis]SOU58891.1 conserved hypothetical protein [Frankia canadensis]
MSRRSADSPVAGERARPAGGEAAAARRREQRRAFIRAHHPDVGGDPVLFAKGLRVWADVGDGRPVGPAGPATRPGSGPTAYRRRSVAARLAGRAALLGRLLRGRGDTDGHRGGWYRQRWDRLVGGWRGGAPRTGGDPARCGPRVR